MLLTLPVFTLAAVSLGVTAASAARRTALSPRQNQVPAECQTTCAAFLQDIAPCGTTANKNFTACLCPGPKLNDFIVCANCDTALLDVIGVDGLTDAKKEILAACNGTTPDDPTSSNTTPPDASSSAPAPSASAVSGDLCSTPACSAIFSDLAPCSNATTDAQWTECLCGDQQQQDFATCADACPDIVSSLGATSSQAAIQLLQQDCAAASSGSNSGSSSGGANPFSGLPGGSPSTGKNSASAVKIPSAHVLLFVAVFFVAVFIAA